MAPKITLSNYISITIKLDEMKAKTKEKPRDQDMVIPEISIDKTMV